MCLKLQIEREMESIGWNVTRIDVLNGEFKIKTGQLLIGGRLKTQNRNKSNGMAVK